MGLHVHFPDLEEGPLRERLLEGLEPGIELTWGEPRAHPAADILVDGRPTRAQLEGSPGARALIVPWAGLPAMTRELLADFPQLAVHNLHHNAAPATEHAMALLLAVARWLLPADRALRDGDWRPRYGPPRAPLLEGRQALILGAGAIGTRLARACAGLAMRPLLVARRPRGGVHGVEELGELLPRAEVLLIALPATAATDGLLGAAELALLPRGALLVNIGRAAVIDERALFEALDDGHLGGAGLDVWYRYPADGAERGATRPSALPFEELENVVLSPHCAGHGLETARLRARALAELLNQAARGEPLPNRVDLARGY